jgi:WD40 repeat protein
MAEYQDLFISYGRADSKTFAQQLYDRLRARGLEVWFDFADIPLGVDYQKQIDDGIESAHNFIFVISPHAVHSPYCALEIELALRFNKRIIPLLHVEEISQETWQSRNPQGTTQDWEAYRASGKHSAFSKMHPAISKINWIFFREGVDDFDQALEGLRSVVERHQNYVYQHTHYLKLALEWDRHQQGRPYLLLGEALRDAQHWLQTRFTTEQAPCLPTDLHCAFITKSLRNDRSDRTEVYLCYADEDQTVATMLYWNLVRQGWLVWNRKVDLKTGGMLQDEVFHAIEAANNFVYCLSAHALRSKGCQKELSHALNLEKHIIPLRVGKAETEETIANKVVFRRNVVASGTLDRIYDRLESRGNSRISQQLHSLNQIDFVNFENEKAYEQSLTQLIKELQQDASFYHYQTDLLIRALRWKAHRHNPRLLLQGYSLQQAQSWFKLVQDTKPEAYTALQEDFIQASQQHNVTAPPEEANIQVFLIYATVDQGFTARINEALQIEERMTWFASDQIAAEDPDRAAILQKQMIQANNCIAILSPSLFQEPEAQSLLQEALFCQKRLIPILYRPLTLVQEPGNSDLDTAHRLFEQLSALDWLNFSQQDTFYNTIGELIRVLNLDREYVQEHTKWAIRSRQWHQSDRSEDLLLRGHELNGAETWLAQATAEKRSPPVTEMQRSFIKGSSEAHDRRVHLEEQKRQQELKRARRVALAATVSGVIMAGMALFSTLQLRQAEIETVETLRVSAELLFSEGQELQALLRAVSASQRLRYSFLQRLWPYKGLTASVQGTLQEILFNIDEYNQISARSVNLSPSGHFLVLHQLDGTVQVWKSNGSKLAQWHTDRNDAGFLDISPDDRYVATGGASGKVSLWSLPGGEPVVNWLAHEEGLSGLAFSPDSTSVLTVGGGKAYRWNLQGKPQSVFTMSGQRVTQAIYNPDGTRILTLSDKGKGELWTHRGYSIAPLPSAAPLLSYAFSPQGAYLLTGDQSGELQLWRAIGSKQGTLIQKRKVSDHAIETIAFSPQFVPPKPGDSTDTSIVVATGSEDGVIRLWDSSARLQRQIYAHTGSIQHLQFSHRGDVSTKSRIISSGAEDSILRFWSIEGWEQLRFEIHSSRLNSLQVSPSDRFFVTLTQGGQARAWSLDGHQGATLNGTGGSIQRVLYSQNGKFLATLTSQGTLQLWSFDPVNGSATLRYQREQVREMQFNPDSTQLAWIEKTEQGQVIQVRILEPFEIYHGRTLNTPQTSPLEGLEFSPNGQVLGVRSQKGNVYLWNLSAESYLSVRPHAQPLETLTFHPQDGSFLTTDEAGSMRYWDEKGLLKWEQDLVRAEGNTGIYFVSFSPDGDWFLTAQWNGQIQGWTTQDGKPLTLSPKQINDRLEGEVLDAQLPRIPQASQVKLLVKRSDSSLRLQALEGGELVDFSDHEDGLKQAAFVPNSEWIQTISWGGITRLWDFDGNKIIKIRNHYGQVLDIAVSPDRRWIVTVGRDGTAKLWPIESPEALIEKSCAWLSAYLSTFPINDPQRSVCENSH